MLKIILIPEIKLWKLNWYNDTKKCNEISRYFSASPIILYISEATVVTCIGNLGWMAELGLL